MIKPGYVNNATNIDHLFESKLSLIKKRATQLKQLQSRFQELKRSTFRQTPKRTTPTVSSSPLPSSNSIASASTNTSATKNNLPSLLFGAATEPKKDYVPKSTIVSAQKPTKDNIFNKNDKKSEGPYSTLNPFDFPGKKSSMNNTNTDFNTIGHVSSPHQLHGIMQKTFFTVEEQNPYVISPEEDKNLPFNLYERMVNNNHNGSLGTKYQRGGFHNKSTDREHRRKANNSYSMIPDSNFPQMSNSTALSPISVTKKQLNKKYNCVDLEELDEQQNFFYAFARYKLKELTQKKNGSADEAQLNSLNVVASGIKRNSESVGVSDEQLEQRFLTHRKQHYETQKYSGYGSTTNRGAHKAFVPIYSKNRRYLTKEINTQEAKKDRKNMISLDLKPRVRGYTPWRPDQEAQSELLPFP